MLSEDLLSLGAQPADHLREGTVTVFHPCFNFIHTQSNKPIGHDLARHSLVRLNRIRTGYARFKSLNMNRMGV